MKDTELKWKGNTRKLTNGKMEENNELNAKEKPWLSYKRRKSESKVKRNGVGTRKQKGNEEDRNQYVEDGRGGRRQGKE